MGYDIALGSADHDLLIIDGDLLLIDNQERIAQQIKIHLLTLLGEWFLDTSWGVPYLESILVKNPNLVIIKTIFRNKINNIPGVTKVNKIMLVFDQKGRKLRLSYEAETDYGLVTKREVLQYGR